MITIRLEGIEAIQQRLNQAPASIRTKVLKEVGKRVIELNQQRLQQQQDLDGTPFPPHHRRRRRKMLTRLGQRLKILSLTETEVIIGWRSPVEAAIAAKHQFGATETVTFRNRRGEQPQGAPATRSQAKALLDAGYKRRVTGRGNQTPTLKWITGHLTIGQAGAILRALRGGTRPEWQTTLPRRTVLGLWGSDIETLAQTATQSAQQALQG